MHQLAGQGPGGRQEALGRRRRIGTTDTDTGSGLSLIPIPRTARPGDGHGDGNGAREPATTGVRTTTEDGDRAGDRGGFSGHCGHDREGGDGAAGLSFGLRDGRYQ